jgi:hypothetical protein
MQEWQNRSRRNFDGRRTKESESVESENRFEPGFYIIIDEVTPFQVGSSTRQILDAARYLTSR